MPTPTYDGETFDKTQSEDDKRLFVQFFMEAVKNEFESDKQGRAIFNDTPMIRIITPGSRDVMVNKATKSYQNRFPLHWERFMKQMEQQVEGTPLEQVPFLTVSEVAELKYLHCLSLEQLASMSDTNGNRIMGFNKMRQRAKDFLAAAQNMAPISQLRAELEEKTVQMSIMQGQIDQLIQTNTVLNASKK
jgi:hypothetical protein